VFLRNFIWICIAGPGVLTVWDAGSDTLAGFAPRFLFNERSLSVVNEAAVRRPGSKRTTEKRVERHSRPIRKRLVCDYVLYLALFSEAQLLDTEFSRE